MTALSTSYICAPGYICGEGSSELTGTADCPINHYCPGTDTSMAITPCEDGFYSNEGGLSTAEECILCPAGYYCSVLSDATPPNYSTDTIYVTACPEGYYCPAGLFYDGS
jgi:hypothetical protein